jgi:hypothetical protein
MWHSVNSKPVDVQTHCEKEEHKLVRETVFGMKEFPRQRGNVQSWERSFCAVRSGLHNGNQLFSLPSRGTVCVAQQQLKSADATRPDLSSEAATNPELPDINKYQVFSRRQEWAPRKFGQLTVGSNMTLISLCWVG